MIANAPTMQYLGSGECASEFRHDALEDTVWFVSWVWHNRCFPGAWAVRDDSHTMKEGE